MSARFPSIALTAGSRTSSRPTMIARGTAGRAIEPSRSVSCERGENVDNDLYMACIDLKGKRCLVVGAGAVAVEKVGGLLAAGADVEVVAPEASDSIRELGRAAAVGLTLRPYASADLEDRFLVIVATGDRAVAEAVHRDAEARSMLINVADVPDLCNFILPAVTRRGPVAVAVSTAGASPALAQRIRREASEHLERPYGDLAEILRALRPWAKRALSSYEDRRAFFDSIVDGDPDPVELLAQGGRADVDRLIEARKAEHLSVKG